jgi:phosphatidylglycerophosphate synthase
MTDPDIALREIFQTEADKTAPPAEPGARRPIASRTAAWAQKLAAECLRRGYAPNQISQASVGFAAVACLAFCLSLVGSAAFFCIVAALAIQGRLICNLIDGMVAVEGGQATTDGAFWNEVPDRPSDILILVGAGIGAGYPVLGLIAALAALGTAYIRALGVGLRQPEDFSGPMAKQHRMAVITVACALGAVESLVWDTAWMLVAGLVVVTVGSALTAWLRGARLLAALADR